MTRKIDIKIYGIHERDFLIDKLKQSLDLQDDDIVYDDRNLEKKSCLYTLGKACTAPIPDDVTHRLAMPDDMIVCNDFKVILNKIINAHPDAIVSLWAYQYDRYNKWYKPSPVPYYRDNGVTCGNGVIFPVQYIQPLFDWIKSEHPNDYDTYRSEYGLIEGIKVLAMPLIITIPCPVQHIGDDYGTHLPYEVRGNRKSVYFREDCMTGVDWDSKEILTLTERARYCNLNKTYIKIPFEGLPEENKAFNPRSYL